MIQIRCEHCGAKLGELVDGIIVVEVHVRGGETRRIIARQCIIGCERCGRLWTPEQQEREPVTLKVAS